MNRKQKKTLVRILVATALLIGLGLAPVTGAVRFILYLIPYGIIGHDILKKAGKGIRNRQVFDENFLMAVATIGAIALALAGDGDYTEAIAVMLFYQIGELFQSYAVGKSRRNISELMDIRPDYANLYVEGALTQVDPDEVEIGSEIIVQPGERIPIDGVIVEGRSSLNTSALTGESLPRDVAEGDEVVSGCINQSGLLRIRTTREFGESTASKILELVENASSRKSRSEDFIARFARVYTPAVCYSALVLALLVPLVRMLALQQSADWSQWVYRALTFLVASCPCALVISIPLSFFAGIGGASREGILVKGSCYLETLAQADCVAFDKTGTLTRGSFEVQQLQCQGCTQEELLYYAVHAESASSHPISKSLQRAWGKPVDRGLVSEICEKAGNGVTARVNGHTVAVGNARLMEACHITCAETTAIGTQVYVAVDGAYQGLIVIADEIKPGAAEAIAELKRAGITRTILLTGDSYPVAEEVAGRLGIDEVCAQLLPSDKVTRVEELLAQQRGGRRLAFVGDGINDAPVLSRADIGIAMGAMGSDAAIEAADVVLMDDDPKKIAKAIRISRKCLGIVYQNIFFAIGVKLLCLLLVALGCASMWLAIFADVGVMVLAVLNAIRALFVKRL